ncbi:MAG: MurR/RpiR family transcriptional regulator [Acholeplasmataceae bacterium]
MNSFLTKTTNTKIKFTKTEKVLIDNLKKVNESDLIYMSITELSSKIDIAEATILRFCKKLGYRGFQDFKLSLSQHIGSQTTTKSDTKGDKLAERANNALTQTALMIDYNTLNQVSDLIINANHVCVFGVGNSAVSPLFANQRLIRLGINISMTSDAHVQSIVVSNLTPKDVVILISVSGSTKDIIEVAEIAKERKTPVVVITNYPNSPICKYADYILASSGREAAYEGGTYCSIVSQMFLIDVIVDTIVEKIGDENLIESAKSVSNKAL